MAQDHVQFPSLIRDFLDSVRPTTVVGLFDKHTTHREAGKDFFRSTERPSGRSWATISPQAPCVEVSVADAGGPPAAYVCPSHVVMLRRTAGIPCAA